MGNLAVGSLGWFCYELEAVKKSVPPRSHFIFLTTNGIEATPDVLRKSVMAASRQAERVIRTVKFNIAGPLGHSLFPSQGAHFLFATMGRDDFLSALTADTMAGAATTIDGMTTMTLTNSGHVTYTKGAWVVIGDHTASQVEVPRQIVDILANNGAANTQIKVENVVEDCGVVAGGTKVQQVDQHFLRQIPSTDAAVMTLPTLTIEINEAGKYAWLMAGCYLAKYTMKGGKEDVEVSSTIAASTLPKRLNRPQAALGAPGSAPTLTGSGTGGFIPAGTYTYEVTFADSNGETTPSSASGSVVLTGTTSSVLLTAIPLGPVGTTSRKVYRSNGGAYGLVLALNDNVSTSVTDVSVSQGAAPPGTDTTATVDAWTPFAPSQAELADAQRPFAIVNGYVCVPTDPQTTGVSTVKMLATLEDWELDIDNGLITHDFWNKNRVKDHTPGLSKGTFKYKYANEADRPTEFEDYLVAPYNRPVPGFVSMYINVGTPSVPLWNCWGAHIPNLLITKAPTTRTVAGVLMVDVDADIILGPSGEEPLRIFVANGDTAAYAGVAGTPWATC